jgi:type IV pilus assembly protein PilE
MITVAIVGILASIAIPSYRESISRGHRAEAKSALLDNAQFLERHFTRFNRYDEDDGGVATVIPFDQAPRDGTASYDVAAALGQTTFTLTATPVVGGRMDGDQCGEFSLTNFGQMGVDGDLDGNLDPALVDTCWGR